jgi:hypothetical protein
LIWVKHFKDALWLKPRYTFKKKNVLLVLLSGGGLVLFSQEAPGRRSESLNDTWVHYANPDVRYGIDSTIVNLEEYNGMQRPGSEYLNVGNTGSAAYPLVFSPFRFKGFQVGFNQFEAYRYTFDSTRIYKVMRPYSQLQYIVGQRAEQMFNGKFAGQMFKEKLQFGVDFTRYNSRGGYINQSTNVNGFTLYGFYEPQKRNYSFQTILLLNLAQVKENGGVDVDVFANGNSFFSKKLVPVRLETAKNNYSEVRWMAKGAYHLGKYQIIAKDTTTLKRKVPTFKIGYQTGVGREKFNYFDSAPDSAYYQTFWTGKDSLRYDLSVFHFTNSAFVEFTGQIANSDTQVTQIPFKASASLHYDYYHVREMSGKYGWGNVYIHAVFQNNALCKSKFLYKAAVAYYLAGYNQNDLRIDGFVGYDLKQYGKIAVTTNYHLTEAPLIWQSYSSRGELWSNDFSKQNVLALGGSYIFQHKWISVFADATYHFVKNYFYFSSPSTPMSDASHANVLVLHAGNRWGIKGLHLDNDFWFQPVVGSSAIRLPEWVTRHSIYYENRIFKKVLWFSIGFDVRYNSPFWGNEYFPLTGQWILQNNYLLKFYPVLDGFLNFKVRWFRLTAKVENISSTFGPGGYYTAPNYPAADIAFKMGVVWRFFE